MDKQTTSNSEEIIFLEVNSPEDLPKFRGWLFGTIRDYLKGNILEIDSGEGKMSSLFLDCGAVLHLTDTRKVHRDNLRAKFSASPTAKTIRNIDFQNPNFENAYARYFEQFSAVVALNIVENGYYDKITLQNAKRLIKNGGYLITVFPAFISMYNGFYDNVEMLEQYNRKHLKKLIGKQFELRKAEYFNLNQSVLQSTNEQIGLSALAIAKKVI